MGNSIAFGWYGGKYSHLNWLLPLLPHEDSYCEPFGGSAAVLLNREPCPVETYNDIYGDVTHFFKVLREHPDELVEKIALTPYSREEFRIACEKPHPEDDLERARRFYVRARQVFASNVQSATPGRWASEKSASSSSVSKLVTAWNNAPEKLFDVADRLKCVQIENRDALEVIEKYDSPDTLFYCDPPYAFDTRIDSNIYEHEMTDEDHRELADLLNQAEGKVAVSNRNCDLMNELYSDRGWMKHTKEYHAHTAGQRDGNNQNVKTEVLWTNYDPYEERSLGVLDDFQDE